MYALKESLMHAWRACGRSVGKVVGRYVASRSSLRDYKDLFDSFGIGFVVMNWRGDVVDCNLPYVQMTGRTSSAELINHNVLEWIAPRFHYRIQEFLAGTLAADNGSVPVIYSRPDGSERWLASRILVHGGPSGKIYVVAATDVTAERHNETRLRLCEQAIGCASNAIAVAVGKQGSYQYVNVSLGAGELILLMEDDAEVRGTTTAILNRFGYRIVEACSASDALTTLAQRDDIALVLSDVIMPGAMTGYDLFKEVRRIRPKLPVLLASGYPRDAIPKHVKTDDEPDVIAKPFNIDRLMDVIRAEIGPPNPNRPGYERQANKNEVLATDHCEKEEQSCQ